MSDKCPYQKQYKDSPWMAGKQYYTDTFCSACWRDGQPVGAAGQGGSGINGGPPGDLIVKLRMKYPKPESLTDNQRKVLGEL